ncbi:MAG: hypothetical protein R3B70_37315 [Polyangiaceae bacterium]
MEVRRDPAKNRDAGEIDRLAREAGEFPEGRVRSEARLVAAQAYAHVLGREGEAIELLSAILSDASAQRSTRACWRWRRWSVCTRGAGD